MEIDDDNPITHIASGAEAKYVLLIFLRNFY